MIKDKKIKAAVDKAKKPVDAKPRIKKAAAVKAPAAKKIAPKPPAEKKTAGLKPKVAIKAKVEPSAARHVAPKHHPQAAVVKEAPKEAVAAPVVRPAVHTPKPKIEERPKIEIPAPQAPARPEVHKPPVHKHVVKSVAPVKPATPEPQAVAPIEPGIPAGRREVELELPITVKDLAVKLQEKPSAILKDLMGMGVMVSINHTLQEDVLQKICAKYKCVIKKALTQDEQAFQLHEQQDDPSKLKARSPIVTFMGHVDHGKTSLLDAIRKTKVAESEHGGITQHIGAYRVRVQKGEITFLDTPGHEAFTAMRGRGAQVTDLVVLVVAADDGIMPQTEEAIDHARAAGVPIIVALNKIDKPQADTDRVKKQLQSKDLLAEDWGGKTIVVPVSAKTAEGIDNLLEMILLEAEMLELKANPDRSAKGIVIEAKMERGRGPVATLLVQNGTLRLNDNIVVGNFYGKIRAMFDDRGRNTASAGPSVAAEVLGITEVPEAGEQFYVIEDEKLAKDIAARRQQAQRELSTMPIKRVSLEDLHIQIKEGKIRELKIILKADVQGSLEAIKDVISKIPATEIKIQLIHSGVGNINTSDVVLAVASDALIMGFNISADERAKEMIDKEGIDVKIYNIIYELANELRAAIEGMLEPKLKKVFLGRAEIRKVFKLTRGIIAGCYVTKGKFNRQSQVSLVRNGEVIHEGKLSSLKRFKDDVRDVAEGFECGMSIAGYDQIAEGDVIEAFETQKILRKLE